MCPLSRRMLALALVVLGLGCRNGGCPGDHDVGEEDVASLSGSETPPEIPDGEPCPEHEDCPQRSAQNVCVCDDDGRILAQFNDEDGDASPDTSLMLFTYEDAGRRRVRMGYGRVSTHHPETGSLEQRWQPTEQYVDHYDEEGRLIQVIHDQLSTHRGSEYRYVGDQQLVLRTLEGAPFLRTQTSYSYDSTGQRMDGVPIRWRFGYDQEGRRTTQVRISADEEQVVEQCVYHPPCPPPYEDCSVACDPR